MTYYIKGGSKYNEANPKVWVGLFLGGFPDNDYLDINWKNLNDKSHETDDDPYWRLGSSSGGAKTAEFGLYSGYRIECDATNGVRAWDDIAGEWVDLLTGGGAFTTPLTGGDHSYEGSILNITTAAGAFGEAMYVSGVDTANKADANAVATMPCIGLFVDTDTILTYGTIRHDDWDWTVNAIIYVSAAAVGGLTETAPAGGGDQVQVVGVATNTDTIMVNPSYVLVEVI